MSRGSLADIFCRERVKRPETTAVTTHTYTAVISSPWGAQNMKHLGATSPRGIIAGNRSKQNPTLFVKIGKCIGICAYRKLSPIYLLWSPRNSVFFSVRGTHRTYTQRRALPRTSRAGTYDVELNEHIRGCIRQAGDGKQQQRTHQQRQQQCCWSGCFLVSCSCVRPVNSGRHRSQVSDFDFHTTAVRFSGLCTHPFPAAAQCTTKLQTQPQQHSVHYYEKSGTSMYLANDQP